MLSQLGATMLILLGLLTQVVKGSWNLTSPGRFPDFTLDGPQPPAPYMVNNEHNYFRAAPDKGTQNGAVWMQHGSFSGYMAHLSTSNTAHTSNGTAMSHSTSNYWLPALAPLGTAPLVNNSNYTVFRDVTKYGASPLGDVDATEAINAAIQDGNRCGLGCSSTFTQPAIVYFPPGTYMVCRPIIQLYYTQFVGDATDRPTIIGCDSFQGIALIDTDPYVPDGDGKQWYMPQTQFFRQIRNMVLDLRQMPLSTDDGVQYYVPTGIHWQVAQATSLQNISILMPYAETGYIPTHVGIFTESGSGGFVSDLEFQGGAIGWRAGSQQFTARSITFIGCLTAVQMIWDWGWNWQDITVNGSAIAFNISGYGGDTGQGTGSFSLIDGYIANTPLGIQTDLTARIPPPDGSEPQQGPTIVIDNLSTDNVGIVVGDVYGKAFLDGSTGNLTIPLWASGRRYFTNDDSGRANGTTETGPLPPSSNIHIPSKSGALLAPDGSLFTRSRPQYEGLTAADFLVATDGSFGVANNGTGDQTGAVNSFLVQAAAQGKVAYFPAGIYQVYATVYVPVGSRIQGAAWSQIMGTGSYFGDVNNPKVMVQVGNAGDTGIVEITEMLFTVKGPTAGAILMEWNVLAHEQGSAGMWDSHFRVGGANGSDLGYDTCPAGNFNQDCVAASLLLHVSGSASGYFENVWAWVADHDNDMALGYDDTNTTASQISVYGARGMLIESKAPSWFYGTSSEHSVLYQYQLSGAENVYMGHIQTETPYYQPLPGAPAPFNSGAFPNDPVFVDGSCSDSTCQEAWGLRVVQSENITINGAGLYSFFNGFSPTNCSSSGNSCQQRILEVTESINVALFNFYTVGIIEIATGDLNVRIRASDWNYDGFTTDISVWLPPSGGMAGSGQGSGNGITTATTAQTDTVYAGTEIYTAYTVQCTDPCVIVLPPSPLASSTALSIPPYTTSIQVGPNSTSLLTITVPNVTIDSVPYSNINITSGQPTGASFVPTPSVNIPPVTIGLPGPDGSVTTSRTITLPPWPSVTQGPPENWTTQYDPWITTWSSNITNNTVIPSGAPPLVPTVSIDTITIQTPFQATTWNFPSQTVSTNKTLSFDQTSSPLVVQCPPPASTTEVEFASGDWTATFGCPTTTTLVFSCPPTSTVVIVASTSGVFSQTCEFASVVPVPSDETQSYTPTSSPTPTSVSATLPVWTTWPYIGAILPMTKAMPTPTPPQTSHCDLWFFFTCIKWGEIEITGWTFSLAPGIYPPQPPPMPLFKLPPGITLPGPLPPWPKVTIGLDKKLTYDSKPTSCETETASICSTTTSLSISITSGLTTQSTTTATSVISTCSPIIGCNVEDEASTTTTATTTTRTCSFTLSTAADATEAAATSTRDSSRTDDQFNGTADGTSRPGNIKLDNYGLLDPTNPAYPRSDLAAIIYPANPVDPGRLLQWLTRWSSTTHIPYATIQAPAANFVAFYYLPYLDACWEHDLNSQNLQEVGGIYHYVTYRIAVIASLGWTAGAAPPIGSDAFENITQLPSANSQKELSNLDKRGRELSTMWPASQVSCPPGIDWNQDPRIRTTNKAYSQFYFHDSAGEGQYVYIQEDGFWPTHAEFRAIPHPVQMLRGGLYGIANLAVKNLDHGSGVAAQISGAKLGLGKRIQTIIVSSSDGLVYNEEPRDIYEKYIEGLVIILQDVTSRNTGPRTVVSISWNLLPILAPVQFGWRLLDVLIMLDYLGVVIVVAAGNVPDHDIDMYPAVFASPNDNTVPGYLDVEARNRLRQNMIVVGGSAEGGGYYDATSQPGADFVTTYAPAEDVFKPMDPSLEDAIGYKLSSGTSFAAPQVAAVAAYLRGLPSLGNLQTQLRSPAAVKKVIQSFNRPLYSNGVVGGVPILWNGNVFDMHCLVNKKRFSDSHLCPDIDKDLDPYGMGQPTIVFSQGPPSPTCSTSCGVLCEGFYCSTNPTGMPPDFPDPAVISSSTFAFNETVTVYSTPVVTVTTSEIIGGTNPSTTRSTSTVTATAFTSTTVWVTGSSSKETAAGVTILT